MMEKQFDAKEAFELVTSKEEFLQWLNTVYSIMFEEIGSFVMAKEGGTYSERLEAYDNVVDKHMIGMECLSLLRSKLSWGLFEQGDVSAIELLNPSGRNVRSIERERAVKIAENTSGLSKGMFYK